MLKKNYPIKSGQSSVLEIASSSISELEIEAVVEAEISRTFCSTKTAESIRKARAIASEGRASRVIFAPFSSSNSIDA